MSLSTPPAPVAARSLDLARTRWELATRRLSTLSRIHGAADDAAGVAIAARLASRIGGERIVRQSAMDGLSLAETADGALGQVQASLQRMRELALQARNGTLSDADRGSLDAQYQALGEEVGRVVGATRFNGQRILAEEAGDRPINTGTGPWDTMTLTTPDLRQQPDLVAAAGARLATAAGSASVVDSLDGALEAVGTHRARVGAGMRRLENVVDSAELRYEAAARSYDRLTRANPFSSASAQAEARLQQYAAVAMLREDATGWRRQLLSLLG
ncbi:flagellin [Ideonella sp.]|uniref:flagellin n=1 Tax=Ideonella sp. TaxID=1929293 RepID=UPI0035B38D31